MITPGQVAMIPWRNLMKRRLILSLAAALMSVAFAAGAATTSAKPAKAAAPATAATSVKAATPAVAATPAKPAKTVTRCRDAKGKFIACPKTETAKAKPVQCRDSKGKFIACPKK
jgi:hypothetical protein